MVTTKHITIIMNDTLTLLQLAFVQRAIIGGVVVAVLASLTGILVVLRRSSFYGDAIAHSSLTGVAIGLLTGWQPLVAAAGYAVGIALLLPWLEKRSRLPMDSLLGVILPVSMAMGVLLLSIQPGYQPDLMSFLFGTILSISWTDIGVVSSLGVVVLLLLVRLKKPLLASSFDPEYAQIQGHNVQQLQTLYHVLLALTIVASIQVVGVILVNALLIIPTSTARLFAKSLSQLLWLTPLIAIATTLAGTLISLWWNLPTGPSIAATAGFTLIVGLAVKKH